MSYYGIYRNFTTLTDFRDTVFSYVTSAGWTLFDAVDSYTRVYSSQGENGTYAPIYVRLYFNGTTCNMISYGYWNASTHTGTLISGSIASTSSTYGSPTLISVSKDFILLSTSSSMGSMVGCGFVEGIFHTILTNTTGSIVTGSLVSIPVTNSERFKVGNNYQIHGVNYEGRDRLTVSSIPDSGHIVVSSLPRNYASGAYFGQVPFPAFISDLVPNDMYALNGYSSSGTTSVSVNFAGSTMFYGMGPDYFADDWTLGPFYINNTSQGSLGFFNNGYIVLGPTATAKDTVGVSSTQVEQGIATSASINTLTDSAKSWSTNQFANKYVLIITGTGLGQSRKVTSNTSTILTVQDNWTLTPDITSVYRIADHFYRYVGYSLWVKITEDFV